MAAKDVPHRPVLLTLLVLTLLPTLVLLLLSGLSIDFISTYKADLPRHLLSSSIIMTLVIAALTSILVTTSLCINMSRNSLLAKASSANLAHWKRVVNRHRLVNLAAPSLITILAITLVIYVWVVHSQSASVRPGYTYGSDGSYDLETYVCSHWNSEHVAIVNPDVKVDRTGSPNDGQSASSASPFASPPEQGGIGRQPQNAREAWFSECGVEIARRTTTLIFAIVAVLNLACSLCLAKMEEKAVDMSQEDPVKVID